MKDVFQYKSITQGHIKDVDTATGTVTGYFSVFGNIDSDKDMIMPGAYKKTLEENKSRIKHLWQHDVRYPLAKPSVLKEDNHGLYFESSISKTSYGKDVIQLYADGVIEEHSVGFQTVKNSQKSGYNEITEIKLWEGSTVTFGANSSALVTGMKGLNAEDVLTKMDHVLKSLRNGKFETEEIFEQLDIYFKQLQQVLIDITKESTQPAVEAVEPVKEKENPVLLAIKQFTNDLRND